MGLDSLERSELAGETWLLVSVVNLFHVVNVFEQSM